LWDALVLGTPVGRPILEISSLIGLWFGALSVPAPIRLSIILVLAVSRRLIDRTWLVAIAGGCSIALAMSNGVVVSPVNTAMLIAVGLRLTTVVVIIASSSLAGSFRRHGWIIGNRECPGQIRIEAPICPRQRPHLNCKPDLTGVWMHVPTPPERLKRLYRALPPKASSKSWLRACIWRCRASMTSIC
jgi:hypothetical protein